MEKIRIRHLPVEMVEEILYKLPVKSLLRFKCVSKSWHSWMSSKGFIREHLNQSNNTTTTTTGTHHAFTHHNIIFKYDHNRVRSCSIDYLLNDDDDDDGDDDTSKTTPIPFSPLRYNIYLLISCNGLILTTTNYKDLYLWNPSTRKAKNIRCNASFPAHHETDAYHKYGFVYIESTDDYKVIILSTLDMYMYSSRTDTWKTILNFVKGYPVGHARCMNGRLYWMTTDDIKYWDIVSLDLVLDEKYQIMTRPHFFSHNWQVLWAILGQVGDYLSLFLTNNRSYSTDVWIMKKECCWSKIWTFSHIGRFPSTMMWLNKNGDILVAFQPDLVIDLVIYYQGRRDKLLRYSRVDTLSDCSCPIVYVQSLVDPFALGDNHQQ